MRLWKASHCFFVTTSENTGSNSDPEMKRRIYGVITLRRRCFLVYYQAMVYTHTFWFEARGFGVVGVGMGDWGHGTTCGLAWMNFLTLPLQVLIAAVHDMQNGIVSNQVCKHSCGCLAICTKVSLPISCSNTRRCIYEGPLSGTGSKVGCPIWPIYNNTLQTANTPLTPYRQNNVLEATTYWVV